MEWLFSADARLALGGALGGAVGWMTRRGSFTDGVIQVAVGGICAVYLAPIAIPTLTAQLGPITGTTEELARLSAFVVGIGGVSLSGFIIDLFHFWRVRRGRIAKGTSDE